MAIEVKLNVNVDEKTFAKKFHELKNDDVMYQIHDLFAKMCDPYVPMYTGGLATDVDVQKDKVIYEKEYARYMYMGELYLAENGSAWAHKDEKKHASGIPLNYNKEQHGKATMEWDKAMMREQGDVFIAAVKEILMKRCKELYG